MTHKRFKRRTGSRFTAKAERCIKAVKERNRRLPSGKRARNPFAVCIAAIGREKAFS